jgi:hypothetical protein
LQCLALDKGAAGQQPGIGLRGSCTPRSEPLCSYKPVSGVALYMSGELPSGRSPVGRHECYVGAVSAAIALGRFYKLQSSFVFELILLYAV